MKSALEQMLGSEMNFHLGRSQLANPPRGNVPEFAAAAGQPKNRRNGHSPKIIQGDMGKRPLDIPRDRDGTFEPQLIVHLVRAALKYVTDKDSREVISDLQKIYQTANVIDAEQELEHFTQKWDAKYPTIGKQWRLPRHRKNGPCRSLTGKPP